MRLKHAGLFLILASAAFTAQGANLDFSLASNALAVDYTANLTDSGLEGDLGYLHHTDRVDIGSVGLDLTGNASPSGSPLIFGVGGKFFYVSPKSGIDNGEAIGIGAHFRYTWPTYNRFAIGGELYYAPSIVAFQSLDRYWQTRLTANYSVLQKADVYVGYRYITAAFNGHPSVTLDSSIIVGMSLTF
ncbi:MAG: YfaZ family outer membrane protein [bacterium]